MTDPENTAPDDLMRAAEIGKKSGLRHVYAGNLPGRTGNLENTCCPDCGKLLVARCGYRILSYDLTADGCCPSVNQRYPDGGRNLFGIKLPTIPTAVRANNDGFIQLRNKSRHPPAFRHRFFQQGDQVFIRSLVL